MSVGLDPAVIERELQSMWQQAGAGLEDAPVTRAALFNLVVCSAEAPADIAATIGNLVAALPCRVVVVESTTDPTAAPLQGWTSMHCRIAAHGKQVCCEQITLRARHDALDSIPAAIRGLLLPDLPAVAWVGADLTHPLVDRLAMIVDRLVVDSEHADAAEIIRLDARRQTGLEVSDLAWGRLDPWRELFAACFDAPPFDAMLGTLDEVSIMHGAASRAAALLLAGWIVSRLGWPTTTDRLRFEVHGSRGLERLGARAGTVQFVVEADPRSSQTCVARFETHLTCPVPRRHVRPPMSLDTALVGLLQRTSRNKAYEEALAAAAARLQLPPA